MEQSQRVMTELTGLTHKYFDLNTALSSTNLPPVPTENMGCDTITVCLFSDTSS